MHRASGGSPRSPTSFPLDRGGSRRPRDPGGPTDLACPAARAATWPPLVTVLVLLFVRELAYRLGLEPPYALPSADGHRPRRPRPARRRAAPRGHGHEPGARRARLPPRPGGGDAAGAGRGPHPTAAPGQRSTPVRAAGASRQSPGCPPRSSSSGSARRHLRRRPARRGAVDRQRRWFPASTRSRRCSRAWGGCWAPGGSPPRFVLLPAALPGYLGGLRQGWAFSWRSRLAAELIVNSPQLDEGLGQLLDQGRLLSDMRLVLAGILVVGIAVEPAYSRRSSAGWGGGGGWCPSGDRDRSRVRTARVGTVGGLA